MNYEPLSNLSKSAFLKKYSSLQVTVHVGGGDVDERGEAPHLPGQPHHLPQAAHVYLDRRAKTNRRVVEPDGGRAVQHDVDVALQGRPVLFRHAQACAKR